MTIRPTHFFGGYAKAVSRPAASATARIEKLEADRRQLTEDAERLGLAAMAPDSPIAVSHNRLVTRIDAELTLLRGREEVAETGRPDKTATEAAEAAPQPKQIIRQMPNRQGIYPPGTFLDIYA